MITSIYGMMCNARLLDDNKYLWHYHLHYMKIVFFIQDIAHARTINAQHHVLLKVKMLC